MTEYILIYIYEFNTYTSERERERDPNLYTKLASCLPDEL